MNHISDLFNRLKKAFSDLNSQKEVICNACSEIAKVGIEPEQIEIQNGVVKLNINPSARMTIFMKKREVLEKINQHLPNKLKDIR